MTYEEVKKAIEAEKDLPPGKRKQQVPCAYCTRGGNGSKSCSCGMSEKKYSKYKMCFAGTLLPEAPVRKKKLQEPFKKASESVSIPKLPKNWRLYDKYKIEHTDGTPVKGKQHFVLRLDSDDPVEAKRVAAAMAAYRGDTAEAVAKLCDALQDCLYMARRYAEKSPACESAVFDSETHRTLRVVDYRKTIKQAERLLKKNGVKDV